MSSDFTYVGRGVYSVAEAARLVHLTPSRVRRWLRGYSYDGRRGRVHAPPLVGFPDGSRGPARSLSFADLIEVLFLEYFTAHGVSVRMIRTAAEKARQSLATSHPFSTHRFRTDGKWILEEVASESGDARLYNLVTEQQESGRLIRHLLRGDLDLDGRSVVERWWPQGRKRDIVIDPRRRFGAPIVSSVGLPTHVLWSAFRAEGSYRAAAHWYEVPERAVRQAVAFERKLAEV